MVLSEMAQVLPGATVMPPIGGGIQTPLAGAAAAVQRRRLADETAAWFARNEVHFGVSIAGEVVQRPIPYDPLPRVVDSTTYSGSVLTRRPDCSSRLSARS